MVNLSNLIGDFKKWLDGDEVVAIENETPPARRAWEEFLISLAREVEAVMQREMFTPPGGPTYIPPEYLVFLSREDDAQWQGAKREGLERGLNHVLSKHVSELIGDDDVQTRSLAIELRVDGSLEKGSFRVQPVWDTSSPKTEVRPRKQAAPESESEPEAKEDTGDDDATIVRPRAPLFTLTISRNGAVSETRDFYQSKISIGRGSKDFVVDLKLEGDLEISRKQATVEKIDTGFAVTCEGRNPLEVGGRELQQGDRIELNAGETFSIGAYELKLTARSQNDGEMPRPQRE
jgi:FHA domain